MPDDPPVTMATLPASSSGIATSFRRAAQRVYSPSVSTRTRVKRRALDLPALRSCARTPRSSAPSRAGRTSPMWTMSCIAQVPVAVSGPVISISGVCWWCIVVAVASAPDTAATIASRPSLTPPSVDRRASSASDAPQEVPVLGVDRARVPAPQLLDRFDVHQAPDLVLDASWPLLPTPSASSHLAVDCHKCRRPICRGRARRKDADDRPAHQRDHARLRRHDRRLVAGRRSRRRHRRAAAGRLRRVRGAGVPGPRRPGRRAAVPLRAARRRPGADRPRGGRGELAPLLDADLQQGRGRQRAVRPPALPRRRDVERAPAGAAVALRGDGRATLGPDAVRERRPRVGAAARRSARPRSTAAPRCTPPASATAAASRPRSCSSRNARPSERVPPRSRRSIRARAGRSSTCRR